jgi:D-serine deaminase-like pyridoxal phosphate-dependent protein
MGMSRGVYGLSEQSNWVPTPGVAHADVALTAGAVTLGTFAAETERVLVTVAAAPVCMSFDGTTPTASTGHWFAAGAVIPLHVETAKLVKAIKEGSNARLAVTEFQIRG